MNARSHSRPIAGVLVAAAIALCLARSSDAADDFSPYVTKQGAISRPTDYRDTFTYLGAWAVASKPDRPVDEMHVVYSRPEDVDCKGCHVPAKKDDWIYVRGYPSLKR